MSEQLLGYYNSELAYIRQMGDEFARSFPKIAGRLRLNASGSDDPHVERLIEAFAFVAARIRKKLDDDFPEISEALLEVLHPHYLAPMPPLSVVQFGMDSSAGKLTGRYVVPRHARLETEPVDGEPCRFHTCYETELWPVKLRSAALCGPPFAAPQSPACADAQSVLVLKFDCLNPAIPVGQLGMDSLRFFLSGQRHYVHELYELLFNDVLEVAIARSADDASFRLLPATALQQVGFESGQELLPHSNRTPRSYQLLREYFAFPEKFQFLDITQLGRGLGGFTGSSFEVYIYLGRRSEELEQYVSAGTFRMGCTPVVNLFEMTAEPIRLTNRTTEYQVIPDARRAAAMEIFSIDSVTAVDADGDEHEVVPLYSLRHTTEDAERGRFWIGRRKPGRWIDDQPDAGTEIALSIVDLDLNPLESTELVLKIQTTCLNRDLVGRLPYGGGHPQFRLEKPGPIARVDCLLHPTPTRRPMLKQGVLWKLISQLSLNHLSITGGPDGARTLSELLKVYDVVRPADDPFPFQGILGLETRRVVSRLANDPGLFNMGSGRNVEPGFGRGVEVHVELDEDRFVGTGMFLFASVLERFLALYCSVNSFSRMVLKTRQRKELKRWPPRTGHRVLH